MADHGSAGSHYALENYGIMNINDVYWNLPTSRLYEEVVRRREGLIAHLGPLVVRTGHHTGRSPKDKFIVRDPSTEQHIWWGDVNRPFDPHRFDRLYDRLLAYLQGKDVYVQDCWASADPEYRITIRVITEYAWHSLFARNMFLNAYEVFQKPVADELEGVVPDFTVIDTPRFHAVPSLDGTNSEVYIIVNFAKRVVIIGGTSYGGEIKKSVFTILNYLLPMKNVVSMHCSANQGPDGDVALFFGLSGTGKTTLSSDPGRYLIGDDEHGWSERGIFNFEGGCYAKVIRLSKENEPEIYQTTRRFGTIMENVMVDTQTRRLNLDDDTLTENTRAVYPITHLDKIVREGTAEHPQNIFFLTADAFGVMPPVSILTPEQAIYHFLSGYTAKVAGTEKGLGDEPQATFSACFGAPFLPLHPSIYAELLAKKMKQHKTNVWLVNTGWTGGPYGVGHRMELPYTRAMIRAALSGTLADIPTEPDPIFGVHVPVRCPGVPDEVLQPRNTWADGEAYNRQARRLAGMFHEYFAQFADRVDQKVIDAGPRAD
ncbi:MAG: phosphoenolpyruvate carboxykinase (ATP) [Anaerolineae bacterium]